MTFFSLVWVETIQSLTHHTGNVMNYQVALTLFWLSFILVSAVVGACALSAWADHSRSPAARVITSLLG